VKSTATTIEALKVLSKARVSGIPILGEQGEVVNVLSVRDLRFLSSVKYADRTLTMPIGEYLEEVRADSNYMAPRTVAICGMNDSMRSVITKMNGLKIHRLVVVAHDNIPVGVISLTDVLRFIISHDHIWDEHKIAVENFRKMEKERAREHKQEHKMLLTEEHYLEKVVRESLKDTDDE